ncbi:hypothetical protein TQ38_024745 [Novosphingobium sp. P6W]|nr:hypothetical protein TQ38_024745 [Novosphingobium sp. P6W]
MARSTAPGFQSLPHLKWQPAHRLAIYQRWVELFQFWLMHTMNCHPTKASQYARWKAMRGALTSRNLICGM